LNLGIGIVDAARLTAGHGYERECFIHNIRTQGDMGTALRRMHWPARVAAQLFEERQFNRIGSHCA
jgi:hypothetical protein